MKVKGNAAPAFYVGAGYKWKEAFDNKGTLLDDAASQAFGAVLRWRRRKEPLTAAKLRQVSSIWRRQNQDTYNQARDQLSQVLLQIILRLWQEAAEPESIAQDATPQQVKTAAKKKEAGDRKMQEFIVSLECDNCIDSTNLPDNEWCTAYVHFMEQELEKAQQNELATSPLKFSLGRYSYATCSPIRTTAVDCQGPVIELESCGFFFSSCVSQPASPSKSSSSTETRTTSTKLPPMIPGLWLEFGVAEGKTLGLIARHINRIKADYAAQTETETKPAEACTNELPIAQGVVYGFDSFEGLPEDWRPGFDRGHFSREQGQGPAFPDEEAESIMLVKGWFEDTLPGFLTDHPEPVSLVHVDCDIYSGAKFVLSTLLQQSRLRKGSVVVFDELFNYCGFERGEFKALFELVHDCDFGLEYDWIGVEVKGGMRAALVVTSVNLRE